MITLDYNIPLTLPNLTNEEKRSLRSYFSFNEPHKDAVSDWIELELAQHPAWGKILNAMSIEQRIEQRTTSYLAQVDAVYKDNWEPYLTQLYYYGIFYARIGMDFRSWFEVVNLLRRYLTPHLFEESNKDVIIEIMNGMDQYMDIALSNIGEAYLFEQKRVIEKQRHDQELLNKELENFVYIASHDLQEPLNTITSFASLLEEEYGSQFTSEAAEYLSFIKASSSRMTELITGLLDYSKMSRAGKFKLMSVDALAREVLIDLQGRILKTRAKVTILGELPTIPVSAMGIKMLFQNLISNALKFQKKEEVPEVSISAMEEENHWHFIVEDNGIGIDEKNKDKIFVIFRKLHHPTEYEGNGIGLAHCKKIVEVHGGEIWVESTPGVGSKFHFTISKKHATYEEA